MGGPWGSSHSTHALTTGLVSYLLHFGFLDEISHEEQRDNILKSKFFFFVSGVSLYPGSLTHLVTILSCVHCLRRRRFRGNRVDKEKKAFFGCKFQRLGLPKGQIPVHRLGNLGNEEKAKTPA